MTGSATAWQRPLGRPAKVALVPAAGSGSRSGSTIPKQYVPIAGRCLIQWTLEALLATEVVDAVAVALSPDDDRFAQALAPEVSARTIPLTCGGATRAHSVLNGLKALRSIGVVDSDWVLVHDAARCLVRPAAIERLIRACEEDAVGGLLALPVADTLKRAAPGASASRVQGTVARDGMWAAQTPQMFRLGLLQQSLEQALQAGVTVTDEASAIEHAGHAALLVPGDADNFKITYPGDFQMADALLAARASQPARGARS